MKFKSAKFLAVAAAACAAMVGGTAHAALTTFQTFVGNVGVSTDGWGGTGSSGGISAMVPAGATVRSAYLFTSTNNNGGSLQGIGGTLAGSAVSFDTNLGTIPAPACCALTAGRTDVTSIIKPLIDGGPGGLYNFQITESNSAIQDGEALVVVYDLPSLPFSTVGILDGFAQTTGDSASITFANALDPAAPGFFAEMRLGIGFSFNNQSVRQTSRVLVNGDLLTENAGNFDDGAGANGALITVGGFDDPLSPALPTVAQDKERYNLVPFVDAGDTSINIRTFNSSNDDLIFLSVFHVSGEAVICTDPNGCVTTVPEPLSLALVGMALAGLGYQRRRAQKTA